MKFTNPQGLWLGLSTILIIALYLRKEQKVEIQVPNMKLWDEVFREREGLKVNKINKYLPLILQLITAILVVLALSGPIFIRNKKGDEITIFFDSSLSMRAVEKGESHFEMGKEQVKHYIDGIDDEKRINLVFMKDSWELAVEKGRKQDVLKALDKASCSKETLNLNGLAPFYEKFKGEKIFVSNKNLPVSTMKIGKKFENIGITYGNYDHYTGNLIYRLKNYSHKEEETFISFLDELGNTKGIEKTVLKPGEEVNLYFHIEEEPSSLYITIENQDMLDEDNKYFVPIGDEYKKKIALIGDNFFLEKALESIPAISYEKVDSIDEEDEDYDLYIVSKKVNIPSNIEAGVWYVVPQEDLTTGKVEGQLFSSDEALEDSYVKEAYSMKEIEGFSPTLEVDGKPVAMQGFSEGRKIAYMTIDLTKSSFPMTPYLPIFVQDTLDWFFDGKYHLVEYTNPPESMTTGSIDNIKNEVNKSEKGSLKSPVLDLKNVFILIAIAFLIIEWKVYYYATDR